MQPATVELVENEDKIELVEKGYGQKPSKNRPVGSTPRCQSSEANEINASDRQISYEELATKDKRNALDEP